MTKRIVIAGKPREKITVDLVGKEYVVRPFKASMGMLMAKQAADAGEDQNKMLEMIDDTVRKLFGEKQAVKIQARLQDEEDELDIPQIFELVQQLSEASTEDETPTT